MNKQIYFKLKFDHIWGDDDNLMYFYNETKRCNTKKENQEIEKKLRIPRE